MDRGTRVIILLMVVGSLIFAFFTADDEASKEFLTQVIVIVGVSIFYLLLEAIEHNQSQGPGILWHLVLLTAFVVLAILCVLLFLVVLITAVRLPFQQ